MEKIILEQQGPIARLTLNQPAIHNAFDDQMIAELLQALQQVEKDPKVRVLLLQGNGRSFSAGADIHWMQRMQQYSLAENQRDAQQLAQLMRTLYQLSKPTIALVNGPAIGGGVGLVACCDLTIAHEQAFFCLSETKIGLIPAVISPYVINAIGERQARRYFLTAEKIASQQAQALGLIHEICPDEEKLQQQADYFIKKLLANSPQALSACKQLIGRTSRGPLDDTMIDFTIEQIANIRVSAEGQEGLSAFLEKRPPDWSQDHHVS